MEDGKLLKEVIAAAMDERNVNIKKLAETTGIPERFVMFFLEGELRKLPPAPYARGYLQKIARTLDLDHEDLFRRYRNEVGNTSSGPNDRLPGNRFALKSKNRKILVGAMVAFAVVVYLGWNANKLLGAPTVIITEPIGDTITTIHDRVTLVGSTDFNNKVTINEEQIYVEEGGKFTKEYSLQEGLNTFEIRVKKFLGREIVVVKKVIREIPEPLPEEKSDAKSKKELKNNESTNE